MKLENIVMPLFGGLIAAGLASGINEETIKFGIEVVGTYLVAIPIGVTSGYLLDRFYDFLESKGYDFSGSLPKP